MHDDSCYQVFTEPVTFLEAEERCADEEALLTSITSLEEHYFVSGLVGNDEGWLGGKFEVSAWVWLDGTVWNKEIAQWDGNTEPSDGDCIKTSESSKWVIVKPDDSVENYVCKKAADIIITTPTDEPTEGPTTTSTGAPTDPPSFSKIVILPNIIKTFSVQVVKLAGPYMMKAATKYLLNLSLSWRLRKDVML